MNKTFKSVWNESSGTYVAASENTTARGRKTSSTRAGRRMPRRGGSQRFVLEPRIVFDGALPVAAADAVETKADIASKEATVAPPTTNAPPSESNLQPAQSAQQERAIIDGTLALDGQTSNEIIFIDSAVEGLQNFLLDHPQADVVLIDGGSDGMEQIAAALEGRTDIEAIHILSHGSSGQLNLGDATFNLQSINGEHADELATIKSALSAEADILIYGCDVGAQESGQDFMLALSEATGADIAASTDLTGAADLGGDWDLESKTGTLETESFSLEGFSGVLLDPTVDLNSDPTVTVTGPVDTVTTATTNLVNTGDFGTTAGQVPPAPWVETFGANNGQVVLDGSGDGRYDMTQDDNLLLQAITVPADTTNTTVTSSSTATTTTDVSTTVTTTNEISSISFDLAWQNADVTGENLLSISYSGILYATFNTASGGGLNQAGLSGNWTYSNGATGPTTTTSVTNEVTGALTNITINLPTGITGSGNLVLDNWNSGVIPAGGSDDVAIDNVVVNNTETTTTSVTTTVTTADTADNDWTATFTENGPAVSIADIDSSIFDGDSANMQSAAITLTNPAAGDRLLVDGSFAASGTLLSGIAWTRTDTSVSFSGVFTKAEYAEAIEFVQFENTTDNPSATARIINVTVNDGTADSNVAVATINVTPVDDVPVNTVPAGPLAATEDTSLSITGISVLDLDAGNPTEVESTVLSVDMGGTLTVIAGGGAVITNNGSGSVTITGNAAAINATLLNNVSYQGASNFSGTETVNVLTTDTGGVNSDSDNITINVAEVLDPIVDLNSDPTVTVTGPVVTVTPTTTDLVTSGDFGTVGPLQTPPAPWVEFGGSTNQGRVVLDGSGDGRYQWRNDNLTLSQAITVPADTLNTTNTSSSTETTTTDVSTTVTTANEITSITFGMAWQNSDTSPSNNDNQLIISYSGVTYATFETFERGTQNAAGLIGTWTYSNGASGPQTQTLSVTNERFGTLTPITINLPTGVNVSGALAFFYTVGSTGSGSDDLAIDNVVVNNTTTTTTSVTTTVTTADTADNDWTATFTENGPAVSIADIDSSIFDGDSANMQSAAITLTNPAAGDRLLVNGSSAASGTLVSGIAWTRTDTSVSFSGIFTKAQYAEAIEFVQFENTTDNPSATARIINVTVNDGSQDSNVAVATINVTPGRRCTGEQLYCGSTCSDRRYVSCDDRIQCHRFRCG